MNVGIDAIGLGFPRYTLDLADLALARGVDPAKFIDGLGTKTMGVPAAEEDTVTLAVAAARDALGNERTDDIGLCIVGTETGVDHSKPVAAFVHGLLGLPRDCRIFETKHACYGGTAALQNALDWIRSGSARGRKALVICADIARYGLGNAGEPTQGAGAIAMLISAEPRLVVLEAGKIGTYANDVFDFWRPLYSKDAVVDGHYSVTCYLDALAGAYRAFQQASGRSATAIYSDQFAALCYHVPYGKMAKKAHRHLRQIDGDQNPDESFARLVQESLELPSRVGNIYTGSLYLALSSLLATASRPLGGQAIGLFSYGSGSCAEFFSGVVTEQAQALVQQKNLIQRLDSQERLTIQAYEQLMQSREGSDQQPAQEASTLDGVSYLGIREHRRIYSAA